VALLPVLQLSAMMVPSLLVPESILPFPSTSTWMLRSSKRRFAVTVPAPSEQLSPMTESPTWAEWVQQLSPMTEFFTSVP